MLLLSLLVPTFSRVKEMVRRVVCSSNLHQQGIGLQTYAAAYKYYPGHCGQASNGRIVGIWPTRIRRFAGGSREVFSCPSMPDGWKWQVKTGSGAGYAQQADVDNWSYELGELLLDVMLVPFCYGYNDWGSAGWRPTDAETSLGGQKGLGGDIRWGGYSVPELSVSRVKLPNDMYAIGDCQAPDGSWDFNIDPTNSTEYPGNIHSNGANVVFCDGHVLWRLQSDLIVTARDVTTWNDKDKINAQPWNNHHWWNAWEGR